MSLRLPFGRGLAGLLVLVALSAQSQELPEPEAGQVVEADVPANDLDGLFSGDVQDVPVAVPGKVDVGELVTSTKPNVTGNVRLKGGFSLGWSDVPDFTDIGRNFQKSLGYSMSLGATMDARPDKNFRVFASVSASFPAGITKTDSSNNPLGDLYAAISGSGNTGTSISWSNIALDEVYVDYTLADLIMFRIGKTSMTWGQGRVIGNPGNFLAGVSSGATLKASVPLLGGSLNGVVMAQPDYFGASTDLSPTNLGVAGSFDSSIGPVAFGLAGFSQKAKGNHLSLFIKSTLLGVDIYSETVADLSPVDWAFSRGPKMAELAGVFWEGLDPTLQVQAEYLFNGATAGDKDHSVAVGVALKRIPGTSCKIGLQWMHTFQDNSGNVVLGFNTPLADHLSLSLAIPFLYGEVRSRYVPTATTQRIGLAVSVELSGSY